MNTNSNNENIYCSCVEIENFSLNITTTRDTCVTFLTPCCEMALIRTDGDVLDNPIEIFNRFDEFRNNMINENKRIYHTDNKERLYTTNCINCPKYITKEWKNKSDKVTFIALSMGHAPCQSKCIYCDSPNYKYSLTDHGKEVYDKIFNFLDYLKMSNKIHEHAFCQTSSGEIAIHPYKDRILKFVDNINTMFLSNCVVFDIGIADHLKKNPYSTINLSIDSGTSSTWKNVKGINTFYIAKNNLHKYYQYCDQKKYQQITLKYIVLPGINTNIRDYRGVIKIMKELDITNLTISRNLCTNFNPSSNEYKYLFKCIIELAYLCKLNNFTYDLFFGGFTIEERNYIDSEVSQYTLTEKIGEY